MDIESLLEKENLELIFNTSPDAVLITRLTDGRFVRVNDGFTTMTGFSRDEVIGKSILDIRIWNDPIDRHAIITTLTEHGHCENREAVFQRKDGTLISGLISAKLISFQGIPHIISVTRDISDRKQVEQDLIQSKKLLELALRAAGAGTWDWDITAQQLKWSNELFILFGLNHEKDEATFDNWNRVLHPEDRENAGDMIIRAIKEKTPLQSEYRILHPDGQVRWINALGNTLYDEKGEPLRMTGICTDITDRRRIEEALRLDITARKVAEEKLRLSEERYRKDFSTLYSIFESPVDIIIFSLDENYCYTAFTKFHSETMKKIWGTEVAIGSNMLNLISNPNDRLKAKNNFDRALSGDCFMMNEEYGDIARYRTTYDNFYNAIKDEHGNITGISVFVIDVTSRTQAQSDLQKSMNKYRDLVDLLPQVIFETDAEGKLTFVNKEAYRIFGYPEDKSITGMPSLKFHVPEERSRVIDSIQRRLAGIPVENHEYNMVRHDGSRFPALVYSEPKMEGSQPAGLRGIIVDISERKQTEEALRKNEEILRETNAYLESLFNHANAPIIVWDPLFHITRFNHAFEFLTGRTEAEVLGMSLEILFPPELIDSSMAHIRKTLTGERWETVEIKILHRDGTVHIVLWNSANIFAADGFTAIATIAQGYNITKRKQAEAQLVALNETLEQRVSERTKELETTNRELSFHLREIEQFTFIASHDLQEPLLTLRNYTNLIHEEYAGKLDEVGNKSIEFISSSAERMRGLVKGLLDYSLLGKESVLTKVDCKALVKAVLDDLADSISRSESRITTGELPVLTGYETELRLLFQNLIDNALKFRNGNVPSEITISSVHQGDEILFTVDDNGIGIAEKDRDNIFVIFKRMHNRNQYEGTGIGLAHCKKIVELHHGKIWVEAGRNGGSAFRFSLPVNIFDNE